MHRGLDEHLNENIGEKVESFKSLIYYAKVMEKENICLEVSFINIIYHISVL